MSGVTGGVRKRTTDRIEAPVQPRKRPETATPRTYGTAPYLDPSARSVLTSFQPEPSLFTQLRALPRRFESMALLDHENLDVYHRSIELPTLALRLVARLPRGARELRDRLKRAAMSVPLNIAEGSGKPAPADRARFYAIARGSAMECGALADVCRVAGFLPAAEAQDAKTLLARIVAMLTRRCRG